MVIILAFVVGGLFASGIYMMLRRSIVKLIIGLVLLSHGANLLLFTMSRLIHNEPVFILLDDTPLPPDFADPILQALILTAIVISFGVQAFAMVLIRRAYQTAGTDDLDQMNTTDTEIGTDGQIGSNDI